jgi:hypothetical protein
MFVFCVLSVNTAMCVSVTITQSLHYLACYTGLMFVKKTR